MGIQIAHNHLLYGAHCPLKSSSMVATTVDSDGSRTLSSAKQIGGIFSISMSSGYFYDALLAASVKSGVALRRGRRQVAEVRGWKKEVFFIGFVFTCMYS